MIVGKEMACRILGVHYTRMVWKVVTLKITTEMGEKC